MRLLFSLLALAVAAAVIFAVARGGDSPTVALEESLGAVVTQAPEAAARLPEAVREKARPAPAVDCPQGTEDCVKARGPVLYVEAVDPDGDGDMHVVIAGGSVTAPGISIIKIVKERRPSRVPRAGDAVSAAGVVTRGSRDESQLKALAFRVVPR